MYVCTCEQRPEEGIGHSRVGVTGSLMSCLTWVQEEYLFLTAEPPLQPHPFSLSETESLLALELTSSPRLAARKVQGSPLRTAGRHRCTGLNTDAGSPNSTNTAEGAISTALGFLPDC